MYRFWSSSEAMAPVECPYQQACLGVSQNDHHRIKVFSGIIYFIMFRGLIIQTALLL
jgi:hypothetical protein